MSTTARGVPYPSATDANNVPGDLQALATWVNDRPGTQVLTTTQRNALAGANLWDGRLIFNSTAQRIERYKASTTSWVTVIDGLPVIQARTIQAFDSSGTWTKPSGCTRVTLRIASGGQAGENSGVSPGAGGAHGGYLEITLPASAFGATATVTVGAGGLPSAGTGGDSSVSTATLGVITVKGGTGSAPDFPGATLNGVHLSQMGSYAPFFGGSAIMLGGGQIPNQNELVSTGPGAGGGASATTTGDRGMHATYGLAVGGAGALNGNGSPGAAGDLANGICGAGGGGSSGNGTPGDGGAGGKYGGGGGGAAGSGRLGGVGGQGGVAIISHFD